MSRHLALVCLCALAACGDNLPGPSETAPVVDDFALTTDEDTPVTRAVTATGGGASLSLTASVPAHGTVDVSGLSITYTPEADFNGSDAFVVTISDGTDMDTAMIAVTVAPVNDAPVAAADSFAANEDVVLAIPITSVLANDTDVDGDTLTVTALGTPAVGTATITGTDITFTPPADFVGTTSFDYTISDGTETASASITIAVGGDNDAPVAGDDTVTTDEDAPAVITTLLANDTDPEGQTLSITAVANATNGTVSLNGNEVTFTPAANFNGTGTFEYTVSDGADTDTGAVAVTIAAVNDPPVADDEAATTPEDTAVAIAENTLLAGDSDVEGNTLMVTAAGNAMNGTVVFAAGTATFTPAANFSGTASFDYTVNDGTDNDTGTVTITVGAVNDAPVAGDDTATVQADTALVIPHATLLANDTDVDDPILTLSAVGTATNGTITRQATTVTFTPDAGFVGTATFEYTAFDGTIGDVGTVTVTVTAGPVCGDGTIASPETCDDSDIDSNDGCSSTCQIETGWTCTGAPSTCTPICGDNMTVGDEACDDGDPDNTDGCTTACVVGAICDVTAIPGGDRFSVDPATGHCYVSFDTELTTFAAGQTACAGVGGYLATVTSAAENTAVLAAQNTAENPWIGAGEDGNDTDAVFDWVTDEPFGFTNFATGEPDDDVGVGGLGDCLHLSNAAGQWADTNCLIGTFVVGRICEVEPQPCGDSILQTSEGEQCDDSNNTNGDGCSATCQLETTCGNGTIETGEQCDDDNASSFDGCSATCQIEAGATCSGTLPTVCSKLVINEVDYDNTAGDNTNGQFEFVEILNAGTGPADVTNVALILMNGSATGGEYFFDGTSGAANVGKRIALASAGVPANTLAPGGMIVVGPAGLTGTLPGGVFSITVLPGVNGFIQNGPPDAIGLFDLVAARMLDSLAYEGEVTGVIVNVAGTFVFTEGTSTATAPNDTAAANESLSRRNPNARDTQDNASDFSLVATSPGLSNP